MSRRSSFLCLQLGSIDTIIAYFLGELDMFEHGRRLEDKLETVAAMLSKNTVIQGALCAWVDSGGLSRGL